MRLRLYGLRKTRLLAFILFLIAVYGIVLLFSKFILPPKEVKVIKCHQSSETRAAQKELLVKITTALDSLPLSYFLCYNSLWGALNIEGPLDWDDELDICLLNEEVSKFEEAFILRAFKNKGLIAAYSSSVGEYKVCRAGVALSEGNSGPQATLHVFEKDSITNHMRRIGWTNRILPPDSCEVLKCFPPRLVEAPLPALTFMNIKLPVPREGIELQKYLYPLSWWKDLKPTVCI